MPHAQRDIGSHIKVIKGFEPQADDGAAAETGDTIDRHSYGNPESAVLHVNVGGSTGTPTSFTVNVKIEHSDDDSTYSDLSGAAITAIAAVDSEAELDIDLSVAKRYIRTERTVAFVGGSSPTLVVSEILVLGGGFDLPQ